VDLTPGARYDGRDLDWDEHATLFHALGIPRETHFAPDGFSFPREQVAADCDIVRLAGQLSRKAFMSDPAKASEIDDLIEQLSDPQTRRFARQELKKRRETQAFIGCLASPNDSVVWAAVQSLAELRAEEAVEPLVELLERRRLVMDVAEALTAISGQDFGVDAARWRMWLTGQKAVGPTAVKQDSAAKPAPSKVDLAQCVRQAAELLALEPTGSGKSFEFQLAQPDGRTQRVHVHQARAGREGEELAVVYSECGPAQEKHYAAALRRNCQLPIGAFGIRDINSVPTLVLVETLPAAALTPRLLARAIENIAGRADYVEKDLTGEDVR
jgi:hypothetical protein